MNYTDFREKIIIKGVDKKFGNEQRVCLRMYRDWETDRKSTRLNSSHRL